jgi:hypothetical protein
LAAWYYLDSVYSDEDKLSNEIYTDYVKLGNLVVARLNESDLERDKAQASTIRAKILDLKRKKQKR